MNEMGDAPPQMKYIEQSLQRYLRNQQQVKEDEKEMNRLRGRVNEMRHRGKSGTNQELVRREEDEIKDLRKELKRLRQEKEVLLKLQGSQVNKGEVVMKQSIGLADTIRNLRGENRVLLNELRDKEKVSMKQHSLSVQKRIQGREGYQKEELGSLNSLNKQIEETNNTKADTQNQLKRQLEQVDTLFNKAKVAVDKKKQILEERSQELAKLKHKVLQKNRIRASLEKQKQRQGTRAKSQSKSMNEKGKSVESSLAAHQKDGGTGEIEGKVTEIEGQLCMDQDEGYRRVKGNGYLSSMASMDEREIQSKQVTHQLSRISKVIKSRQLKNYNSIGIGTTFYYDQQYDKF